MCKGKHGETMWAPHSVGCVEAGPVRGVATEAGAGAGAGAGWKLVGRGDVTGRRASLGPPDGRGLAALASTLTFYIKVERGDNI